MARAKIGDERRAQILSAFEACVIREGLAKTTLQKVADEADLPRSLVRYFIGNRGDMVPLLIDRMMERAEDSMSKMRPKGRPMTINDVIDLMFDGVFANETTNGIIGELWDLAERDDAIRIRLAKLYDRAKKILIDQLRTDGLGSDEATRESIALAIMSLAYGEASFAFLYQNENQRDAVKRIAKSMVTALEKSASIFEDTET